MSLEVVTVGVGQCGVQNMSTIWETICMEHQIGYDGQMVVPLEDNSFLAFFDENQNSIFVPRCLIFDFEESVVDSLRRGKVTFCLQIKTAKIIRIFGIDFEKYVALIFEKFSSN